MPGGKVVQSLKVIHIIKGVLTWVPILNSWRLRRVATTGSDSSRYCYSGWLRHLVKLHKHGFKVVVAKIGELGQGDSVGMGLSALLSGAKQYIGLDV